MLWALLSGAGFEVIADDIEHLSRRPGLKYSVGLRARTDWSNQLLTVYVRNRVAATWDSVSFEGRVSDSLEHDQAPVIYALL